MIRSVATALLLLAAPLVSQTVWIVDADGRPGSNFTTIQAAIDAARAGDTIRVRLASRSYAPFAVSKGVSILAERDAVLAAPTFTPLIVASRLPWNETLVIDGFRGQDGSPLQTQVIDCFGLVVLSRLRALDPGNSGPTASLPVGFYVSQGLVIIDECENFGRPALNVVGHGVVVVTRSRLGMTSLGRGLGTSLRIDESTVMVTESVLDSSMALSTSGTPEPAVDLVSGSLFLGVSDITMVQGSMVRAPAWPAVAIRMLRGYLVCDPDVRLNPAPGSARPIQWLGGTIDNRQVGAALIRDTGGQGSFDASVYAVGGAPAVMALDLPRRPVSIPGFSGAAWIGPGTLAVLAAGVTPPSGELAVQIPLPPGLLPPGLPLCVQGVVDVGYGLELTTPAIVPVR